MAQVIVAVVAVDAVLAVRAVAEMLRATTNRRAVATALRIRIRSTAAMPVAVDIRKFSAADGVLGIYSVNGVVVVGVPTA